MDTKGVEYLSAVSLNERLKFIRLLFRWKNSLWKLLWADFLWFFLSYVAVTCLYQFYLIYDPVHKRNFEAVVAYMNKVAAIVPLSFLLGFFVSTVLGRWWTIVSSIPWMTKPALACQALIADADRERSRDIRTAIIRYMNISWIMAMLTMSSKLRERFQVKKDGKDVLGFSKADVVRQRVVRIREKLMKINSDEAVRKHFGKLIMDEEIMVFENYERISKKPNYLIPLMWSTKLIQNASKAGSLKSDSSVLSMIQNFQSSLESMSIYNTFNVPLVYTQVIIIVVYVFLLSEILSQQIISVGTANNLEAYFPIFALFKFLIYMGWFKVGLCFINPFGSEQNDLPLDAILDYNLEISSSVSVADDICFPEYLCDSFNDSDNDRFEIFKKFRFYTPKQDNLVDDCSQNNEDEMEIENFP